MPFRKLGDPLFSMGFLKRFGLGNYNSKLGVSFAISISPTIGNTITIDGDMEAVGVASWSAAGTPTTREKSGTQKHGGAQSLHLITDATGEGAQQVLGSQTPGRWFHISAWCYVASGDATITGSTGFIIAQNFTLASWVNLIGSDILTGASPRIICRSFTVAASEFYMDDVYQKPLTLNTCFATPRTGVAVTNVGGKVSATGKFKIGYVANLDSITNPLNYVLAVIDSEKAWLYQVSNGTYTAKINGTAITYVADKVLEIRHIDATTYQLWYNGSQVGANQTINDANINNNTLYSQFSTYAGNEFSSFTL